MTIDECKNLKNGDKVKQIKPVFGFGNIGRIYEIREVEKHGYSPNEYEKKVDELGDYSKEYRLGDSYGSIIFELKNNLPACFLFKGGISTGSINMLENYECVIKESTGSIIIE